MFLTIACVGPLPLLLQLARSCFFLPLAVPSTLHINVDSRLPFAEAMLIYS